MALDWLPIYPDWLPVRFRRATYEPIVRFDVNPIPNPLPPTELTWHPTYPDRLFAQRLPTAAVPSVFSGFAFLGTDLRARAIHPDWFPRKPWLIPSGSPFQISSILDIPIRGSWRPRYPDRLWRTPQTATGFFAFVTPPSVILDANSCLIWVDDNVINPDFIIETVQQPALTDEALVNPDLISEDLCP